MTDTIAPEQLTEEERARFWERVDQCGPDKCWQWKMGVDKDGYGCVRFMAKDRKAHRVAFFLTHGRWPRPLCCHHCDNPPCCNPAHLFEGTRLENTADMLAKGRQSRLCGEGVANARLTAEDVQRIRDLHSDGTSCRELAERYGVSKTHMVRVVRGISWRHVS